MKMIECRDGTCLGSTVSRPILHDNHWQLQSGRLLLDCRCVRQNFALPVENSVMNDERPSSLGVHSSFHASYKTTSSPPNNFLKSPVSRLGFETKHDVVSVASTKRKEQQDLDDGITSYCANDFCVIAYCQPISRL